MRRCVLLVLLFGTSFPTLLNADPPINLLNNPSFESSLTGWIVSNKSGDKVMCSGTPAPLSGMCVLKLKGGDPGLVLTQHVSAEYLTELNLLLACSPIVIRPEYPFRRTGGSVKTPDVTLTLKYIHDSAPYVLKSKLKPVTPTVTTFWWILNPAQMIVPQQAEMTSIKLQLRDTNPVGAMYTDMLRVSWDFPSPVSC